MYPENLGIIWSKIRRRRFRIRDTNTLEDYFVVDIPQWSGGIPWTLTALKCDEGVFSTYSLDAWTKKWALLSTEEESDWFIGLDERQARFKAKYFYKLITRKL